MDSFFIHYGSRKTALCEIGAIFDTDKSSQRSKVTNSRHCHPYTIFYDTLLRKYASGEHFEWRPSSQDREEFQIKDGEMQFEPHAKDGANENQQKPKEKDWLNGKEKERMNRKENERMNGKENERMIITLGEIGILEGGSLLMWNEFFSKELKIPVVIFGFDYELSWILNFESLPLKGRENVQNVLFMNVKNVGSITKALEESGVLFDILIEDSTHQMDDQIRVIRNSFPFLKPGGILIIEDIFLSFDEKHYWSAINDLFPREYETGYFIRLDHVRRNSSGWDNDKLLILFRSRT